MKLKAKANTAETLRQLDAWGDRILTEAAPRAINALGRRVERKAVDLIASEYRISPGQMRKYLKLTLSSGPDVPASLVARGKGFPLSLFGPTWDRRRGGGVTVTVRRRPIFIPHAFLLRVKGGDRQVFARGSYSATPGGRFKPTGERSGRFAFGKGRFPISILRTLGPPEALRNRAVVEGMIAECEERAAKELAREIRALNFRNANR